MLEALYLDQKANYVNIREYATIRIPKRNVGISRKNIKTGYCNPYYCVAANFQRPSMRNIRGPKMQLLSWLVGTYQLTCYEP